MAVLRFGPCLRTVACGLFALLLTHGAGCAPDAVGIDACRRIEAAHCDAAATCGLVEDATACRRFYYDQCLHGLPGADPGVTAVNACVAMIERANECAVTGPDTQLEDCSSEVSESPSIAATACDLITQPELGAECYFLNPDGVAPVPGGEGGAPSDPPGGEGGATEPTAGANGEGGTTEPTAGATGEGGTTEPSAGANAGGSTGDAGAPEPAAGTGGVD